MRLRNRLIKGTVLNLVAVSFNQGSSLITNIIVARILKKQIFGEYAMVYSTLLTVANLSQLATGYTASKYIAEYRTSNPQRAGRIMGVCTFLSALMAGVGAFLIITIAPWLAKDMLKAAHLAFALMIGSVFVFFFTINRYQIGALSGLEAYGSLAKAGVVSGIVSVIIISIGAWLEGLNGTFIGLSISSFVRYVIHYRLLQLESRMQGIKIQCRGSLRQEKELILKFAIPVALTGLSNMPTLWLGNCLLVRLDQGFEEMGVFSAANRLRMIALLLPNIINQVNLSLMNNLKGLRQMRSYRKLAFISTISMGGGTAIFGAMIIIFGRLLLSLFGKEFLTGNTILIVLVIAAVVESFAMAAYQIIQSHEKVWHGFLLNAIPRDLLFVALAYTLVPHWEGFGLALSFMLSRFISLVVNTLLAHNIIQKNYGFVTQPEGVL